MPKALFYLVQNLSDPHFNHLGDSDEPAKKVIENLTYDCLITLYQFFNFAYQTVPSFQTIAYAF